jgi:predicted RNA-binding Zn ribbon-like protein
MQHEEHEQHEHTVLAFSLTGGKLCLDFVNTAENRQHPITPEKEHLTGYKALVAWGEQAGVLEDGQARRLLTLAAARPDEAAQVLARAIALREAIYGLFSAVARGAAPPAGDLERLNAALAEGLAQARLTLAGEEVVWAWDETPALDRVLWPVARSAAELLTSEERERVRECAGKDCTWLFLDTSRNRSRQWCDMQSCGNRAKAKRHYQKQKGANP